MLLLYISSNENMGLLDKPCEENKIVVTQITDEMSLSKYISHDVKNMNCYQFLCIDLSCILDNDDEVINTVIGIKSMYDLRIIILASGYTNDTPILGRLFAEGIYNIITAEKIKDIQKDISVCLNSGMQYKDALKYRLQAEHSKKPTRVIVKKQSIKQMISVGVCGALHRIGTTAQALNITRFLNDNGYTACYVEDNGHGHMESLAEFYNVKQNRNKSITFQGIDIFSDNHMQNILSGGYDFTVHDYGILDEWNSKQFLMSDFRIVCAGSKPWEAECIMQVFKMTEGVNDLNFIFSFTPKETENDIRKLMGKYGDKTYFAAPSQYIIDETVNCGMYKKIFSEYIRDKQVQESSFHNLVRRIIK